MNLGLGNLIELKRQLLPATLLTGTTYNAAITAIGSGVARQMDKHCNRIFERSAAAIDTFTADRDTFTVRRFPLELVSKIEQKDVAGTWTQLSLSSVIAYPNDPEENGMIQFTGPLGNYTSIVRVTYTGGYWFDTDESEAGTMPTGATKLPDDVKLAWFLQCREIWSKMDKVGVTLSSEPDKAQVLTKLDLIPEVKDILSGYIRYQMT